MSEQTKNINEQKKDGCYDMLYNVKAELKELRQDINFLFYTLMYFSSRNEWDPTYVIDDMIDTIREYHRLKYIGYKSKEKVNDLIKNLQLLKDRLEKLFDKTEKRLYGEEAHIGHKPGYKERFAADIKDMKVTVNWTAKALNKIMNTLNKIETDKLPKIINEDQ